MKLSEAFEKGIAIHPLQAKIRLFDHQGDDMSACAIGACLVGAGIVTKPAHYLHTFRHYASVWARLVVKWTMVFPCPIEKCDHTYTASTARTIEGMLIHLNDYHSWSFQQILEWIKLQEEEYIIYE